MDTLSALGMISAMCHNGWLNNVHAYSFTLTGTTNTILSQTLTIEPSPAYILSHISIANDLSVSWPVQAILFPGQTYNAMFAVLDKYNNSETNLRFHPIRGSVKIDKTSAILTLGLVTTLYLADPCTQLIGVG